MRTALYPGSFDPVTSGHMDILVRASALFDRVVAGVLHNPQKPAGAFPIEGRVELLRLAARSLPNVEARAFPGLLVDAARACGADVIIRSLRTSADTEAELEMARLNRQAGGMETLFFAADPALSHISARWVREIGRLGGNLCGLVPEALRQRVENALRQTL